MDLTPCLGIRSEGFRGCACSAFTSLPTANPISAANIKPPPDFLLPSILSRIPLSLKEAESDRDRIATKLLEKILREERVKEVQAFLEKGVVARWFTPEVISIILEVDADEARRIYDQLARHSFVERHPYGLKFHDKIRELLLERLKFNRSEYDRIVKRLSEYYAGKAGITSK